MATYLFRDLSKGVVLLESDSEYPIGTSKSEKHGARGVLGLGVVFEETVDGAGRMNVRRVVEI